MKLLSRASLFLLGLLCMVAPSRALDNRPVLSPGSGPEGGSGTIVSGTMTVTVVNGCYAQIEGQVVTPGGGGTVGAFINYWDDGTFEGSDALSFPATGGTASYCVIHQQLLPVLQGAFGLGVYLEDAAGVAATVTFASDGGVDISDICTGPAPVCPASVVEVPTIGGSGVAILVLALAAAALLVLKRRRSSAA